MLKNAKINCKEWLQSSTTERFKFKFQVWKSIWICIWNQVSGIIVELKKELILNLQFKVDTK